MGEASFYPTLFFFVLSLVICALLSFLETSITAMRLFNINELAQRTGGYRELFKTLEQNQHRVLTAIIIAINLVDVIAATLSTQLMEYLFSGLPGTIGFSLGVGITTALILLFGEIIPKNIAKVYGMRILPSMLWLVNIMYFIMSPLVSLLVKTTDYLLYKISGIPTSEATDSMVSEKEVRFMIDYITEKGIITPEKTSMLKSIFALSSKTVEDIMVPATSVISIAAENPLTEALKLFRIHQFSRFPVFEGTPDNVIGMLHLKDLFVAMANDEQRPLKDLVRPILFVPETVRVNQLLSEFKHQNMHIAMVLDEYGGIVGLVTLEDVLEEIVGEIRDEYEEILEKAVQIKPGHWLVDASIELEKLEPLLSITFETEDALTLGGFLIEQLQHIPHKGERVFYKGHTFQVQQASPKRVAQVLVFDANAPESSVTDKL